MQVVFLTHNYPRHADDVAGGFLRPLALALRDRGHDLAVVAPSDGGKGGVDRLDGIPVHRARYASVGRERYAYSGRMTEALRSPGGWWAIGGMIRSLRRTAREVARPGAVIHAHWWFPSGVAAPPERPAVVTLHGTDGRLLGAPLAPFVARLAFRPGRVVTTVSAPLAEAVRARTGRVVDGDHVCPMPVVDRGTRSAGGGGLVFVGRLTSQKRVRLAIEAHARLRRDRPGLALTIVGDGPERPDLEALAARLGTAPAVRFTGQLAPAAVAAILARGDVFVFPAEREGLGLAAVEALMAGLPLVVCRDGGGVLDLLAEAGAGESVAPDPAGIAAAVRGLLDDPHAAGRAHEAGTRWRTRLTPDAVAARCEGWYREALGG
ncbi:MAG: glycosyltransferase [Gemmatimonadales bacterium]